MNEGTNENKWVCMLQARAGPYLTDTSALVPEVMQCNLPGESRRAHVLVDCGASSVLVSQAIIECERLRLRDSHNRCGADTYLQRPHAGRFGLQLSQLLDSESHCYIYSCIQGSSQTLRWYTATQLY